MTVARSKREPKAKPSVAKPSVAKAPAAADRGKRRGAARRKPEADALQDVAEPDRSSPALAEVDADALEFIAAIDRFKKEHGRPFPSWSEVLLVLRRLGYRRP
jgi:hypothetical protein